MDKFFTLLKANKFKVVYEEGYTPDWSGIGTHDES